LLGWFAFPKGAVRFYCNLVLIQPLAEMKRMADGCDLLSDFIVT